MQTTSVSIAKQMFFKMEKNVFFVCFRHKVAMNFIENDAFRLIKSHSYEVTDSTLDAFYYFALFDL